MHPIELLACAIATQEGYFATGDSVPKVNNNPGDLRAAPNALNRPKDKQGIVVFVSPQEGVATLYWQILYYALLGYTSRKMIQVYCPPTGADGGNNTQEYIDNVEKWTGLDLDTPLWNYLSVSNAYLGLPIDKSSS